MNKKRRYKDFLQGQLQQQTLDQFGIDTEDKKYEQKNKKLKLEAINDFQDCLVRLQNFSNIFEQNQDKNDLSERKHLCLAQRRKNFQKKLIENRYFKIMVERYPQLIENSNNNLKYIFRQRSFLTITQKIQIIELRFGSYGSLQNQQISYQNIALRVGAKVQTVVSTVRKYRLQDAQLQIEDKRGGRPKILNQQQIMEICSAQYLQEWSHLSLDKRCDLIQEKYMVKISRFTLSKVYKENQVAYLKTHKSFYSRFTEKQLTQQRLEFISKIARFLHQNQEIIYMDETSTNVWETKYKMWQPKNTKLPMVYTLPQKRDSNVTIIGAITSKRNKIYFTITNTTNIQNVLTFFSHLNRQIGLKNKIIVMDNHPAHHSKVVSDFILKCGGETLFMPPISSYFNPIETIWSWLKTKWRNELMKLQGKQPTRRFMNQTLAKLCDNAPPMIVTNIANSCIGFMTKYFEEYSNKQEDGEAK